jgi:two-component system, cell cycle sensor histidine kinase and response regulator CckA
MDFSSLLRTDERDRIFFAREGKQGSPQTLVSVPLLEPGEAGTSAAADAPSLMLLLDAAVGLGGWGAEARGQTPQLEALLEQLPLGLAMTDRDGHFLFANPAFRRAAAIEGPDLPPYPSDLVIARDKTAMSDAVRRFGQGPANSGDIAVRLRGDPEEPVSLGLAGVRGLGEAAVLLSLADTTEETRLKRQVAQATKMQAVGQLAGGVAHDFNNVLTAIIGYCDLMLLRHTPGDSDYDDIQQIKANSNRAASLTRQLLAFSRQQTLQPEVIQLPDIIAEVSQLMKRLLGAKITLRTHHDRDLGPVRADPRQLEQVIINLAVNARDAIQARGGEGATGTLSFVTRRVQAQDIRRMGSEIIPAGDYTVLVAEDTGGGIAPEVLGKIFEPFFTTKELGKGTGLGLSTVYGIVKQSGGFIFASNAKAADGHIKGARFTVYLPVHNVTEEELARAVVVEEAARDWSGGGRILLVEDEDMVRAVAERALARQGYEVVCASDGDEGLDLVRSGEKFDLVVSDVVMPAMDGPAMAREIRKLQPRLPILFMSGYAEEQLRNQIDIEAMHFIAKPFSVQQIADKVAKVLAGKAKSA